MADPAVWPFAPGGEYSEELAWLTDMLQAPSGGTQHRRLRQSPRTVIAFAALESGAVRRRMDAMLIGAVPRYHTGGVAGILNSNETLSILQRGEVIRTKQQEAALQARLDGSGGGGNVPIRNIIVFSDDELAGAMAGAAGEKVIVNHVRRNRGGING